MAALAPGVDRRTPGVVRTSDAENAAGEPKDRIALNVANVRRE